MSDDFDMCNISHKAIKLRNAIIKEMQLWNKIFSSIKYTGKNLNDY